MSKQKEEDVRRCSATNIAGEPCGAPASMVNDEGLCPAHRPGAKDHLAAIGHKGAEATRKKFHKGKGLDPGELGPLETPQDAARWLEAVGRTVSTGRLTHHQGRTIAATVREWLRAWDSGQVAEDLDKLRQQVAELKGKRKLERVK